MSRDSFLQKHGGVKPKRVEGQLALRTTFYKEIIFKIIKGMFELTVPDSWDIDYFLNEIVHTGYIIITDTPVGVQALKGGLNGCNYLDNPYEAIINVPSLPTMNRTIGEDCELIYLERLPTRSYYTFNRLTDVFAEKLASADASIDVNLMNSKLAYIVDAETKAQAESVKEVYDRISNGDPLVVYRKDNLTKGGMQLLTQNVKQNFIADVLQDSKRTIINELLTYLGINNANTDKKERLITEEVESNDNELEANISLWNTNIKRQVKKVKKMFPDLEFDFGLKFDNRTGGGQNDIQRHSGNVVSDTSRQ